MSVVDSRKSVYVQDLDDDPLRAAQKVFLLFEANLTNMKTFSRRLSNRMRSGRMYDAPNRDSVKGE